jgi:hypothetical protein
MTADVNPSTLATNLHLLYHPIPAIKLETKIQTGAFPFNSSLSNTMTSAEYLGKSSTISLAMYNPKCESGRLTIGFLHSFDNKFCAGAEVLTEWIQNKLQHDIALALRYAFIHFAVVFFQCSKENVQGISNY